MRDLMASKWILPAIGDLPLANIDNMTIKPLVDKMKKSKSFSARSINKYVEYVRQVVTSLKDGETGEPIHRRKSDSTVMDLPLVIQREQRRPSLKAAAVNRLVKESVGEEQALYVLEAVTGMRISEALALEARHFISDGRTIEVRQQVDRDNPHIVLHVRTNASYRDVDLSTSVAEYLRAFIDGRNGLLFKTRNGTPYLHNNLEARWLTPPTQSDGPRRTGNGLACVEAFQEDMVTG